jgi:MFS family permease
MSGASIVNKLVAIFGWQNTLMYASVVGAFLIFVIITFIKDREDKDISGRTTAAHEKVSLLRELKEILKLKEIWLAGFIGFLTYLPLSSFSEMWAVPFLTAAGLAKQSAADGSSLVFFGFALGAPFWGYMSGVMASRKKPLFIGTTVVTLVATWLIWFTPTSTNVIYLLLFSLGFFTAAEILVFAIGNDVCVPRLSATTAAVVNMLVMCGGIIFQPVVGMILDKTSQGALPVLHDYQLGLLVMPIGLGLSFLLTFLIIETYTK